MSKKEFLEKLRIQLSVLEDRETEDILSEYGQHIDLKMQEGLSEEDTIKEFGSPEELAAQILEAYHVKPGRQEAENAASGEKTEREKAAEIDKEKGKTAFSSLCDKGKKASRRILHPLQNAAGGIAHGTGQAAHSLGKGAEGLWQGIVALMKKCMRALMECCRRIFGWAWYLFWLCSALFTGCFFVGFLFCFGLLLVFSLQGYPAVGLTLGSLGLSLMAGGLTVLLFSFRKKDKKAREEGGIKHA